MRGFELASSTPAPAPDSTILSDFGINLLGNFNENQYVNDESSQVQIIDDILYSSSTKSNTPVLIIDPDIKINRESIKVEPTLLKKRKKTVFNNVTDALEGIFDSVMSIFKFF